MMRVINVLHEERFGGQASRVVQVAARLVERQIATTVVLPSGDNSWIDRFASSGVRFCQLPLVRIRKSWNAMHHARYVGSFASNVRDLRRLIASESADIVHANGILNMQAPLAARLSRIPLVWHLNDILTPRPVRPLFAAAARRLPSRIAVSSLPVADYFFGDSHRVAEKLSVLYPPVDLSRFHRAVNGDKVRAELGIGRDTPVIGAVSNLIPFKGLEYVIRAAAVVRSSFPSLRVLIVGERLSNRLSYASKLVALRDSLNLEDTVIFTGARNDIPEVMRSLDVFVNASRAEAGPMTVIEANAVGTAVVSTNAGGPRDLLIDGETGFLVPPENPPAIASRVIELLSSSELRKKMGDAGALRVTQHFSLDAAVMAHERMYRSIARMN